MGMGSRLEVSQQKPIYDAMKDAGIISKTMFSLCLGKNGGSFNIGGFNDEKHMEAIKWVNMNQIYNPQNYKFDIVGVSVNGHPIRGSDKFNLGFVDSGTTFSYLPGELYDAVMYHFDFFCKNANIYDNNNTYPNKYCPGKLRFLQNSDGEKAACFDFDKDRFANRIKDFFYGYPIISIHVKMTDGNFERINWYPSEYLYLDKSGDKYCFAADRASDNQILFGTTLMRQHDFIFDIENKKIGIARANCSGDTLMIRSESDYVEFGTPFPRQDNQSEAKQRVYEEYTTCNHTEDDYINIVNVMNQEYRDFYGIATPN